MWILNPPENCKKILSSISLHFLSFLCAGTQTTYDDIIGQFFIEDPREQWMFTEVLHHPEVDFLHICDGIYQTPYSERVGVFCQQSGTNDPPFVLGLLKVGVREEEEHLSELSFKKEVGEVLHGIATNAGDVLVARWI